MKLAGKTILITGASDGIGRAAAISYAQEGANVILHGRNEEKLQQVVEQIQSFTAKKPPIIIFDLLQDVDYQAFCRQVSQYCTHLDGILHNAGILGQRVALTDYEAKIWQDVLRIHVDAPLFLTQSLMPLLSQSSDASVLFTSSGVGRGVRATWGAYSIAKIAIEQISLLLTMENTQANIRYNCINPGATRTTMRAAAFPDEDPLTLPTAYDIMPMYVYMMSDESRHLHGKSVDAQGK